LVDARLADYHPLGAEIEDAEELPLIPTVAFPTMQAIIPE